MQIKLFTIPISDTGMAQDEMNRFLRGNKILEVESQFFCNLNTACWCFCIRYMEKSFQPGAKPVTKVDYKHELDEKTFGKFSKLRVIRKRVAADESIPAFAIFTDAELAELAKLEKITEKSMRSIKGIGDKKVERYAQHFIGQPRTDEKTGTPD